MQRDFLYIAALQSVEQWREPACFQLSQCSTPGLHVVEGIAQSLQDNEQRAVPWFTAMRLDQLCARVRRRLNLEPRRRGETYGQRMTAIYDLIRHIAVDAA